MIGANTQIYLQTLWVEIVSLCVDRAAFARAGLKRDAYDARTRAPGSGSAARPSTKETTEKTENTEAKEKKEKKENRETKEKLPEGRKSGSWLNQSPLLLLRLRWWRWRWRERLPVLGAGGCTCGLEKVRQTTLIFKDSVYKTCLFYNVLCIRETVTLESEAPRAISGACIRTVQLDEADIDKTTQSVRDAEPNSMFGAVSV
jgi:hypothetical protein